MLRETSLRLAGAAALLFAAAATPALAAGAPPQQAQSAGAPSDQANDTAAAPAEAAKPKEEHKICKRVNGSEARLGAQKVCMTAEQWKKADY
ncbi:MAG TPA: hypothetical protein VH331_17720 [Allosphingosinicella sp.]|nr:hypothetical protein [Allosphingosinicella sp.]